MKTKWDASSSLWTVETHSGEKLKCNVLVSGVGFLHVPKMPDIPGLEDFEVGGGGGGDGGGGGCDGGIGVAGDSESGGGDGSGGGNCDGDGGIDGGSDGGSGVAGDGDGGVSWSGGGAKTRGDDKEMQF